MSSIGMLNAEESTWWQKFSNGFALNKEA